MFSGVRTTVYRVADIREAKDWYSRAFKTDPYFDEPYYVGFNIDGWELGLQPREKDSDIPSTGSVSYWAVNDVGRAMDHLKGLGSEVLEELADVGVKVAVMSDPWGNPIGLIDNPHFRLGIPDSRLLPPKEPGVAALGGIFFKSQDPDRLKAWYKKHLGIEAGQYGAVFQWRKEAPGNGRGFTAWSIMSDETEYFAPSTHDHLINYRVNDLDALLEKLRNDGVEIVGEPEEYSYGKFGWILDPDGRKIELWEPFDDSYLGVAGDRMESH
jgi:predicted enzyme related to lactoylglutathione lyase